VNPHALNAQLIETLSMVMLITSVAAVEIRRLRLAAVAYSAQALLIVGLLLSFAAASSAKPRIASCPR
jgi:hydrogenase-4 membrane subunit HyfE